MKKMAAQVNSYLYLNAVMLTELFGARKLAHICAIKVLLTYDFGIFDFFVIFRLTFTFPPSPLYTQFSIHCHLACTGVADQNLFEKQFLPDAAWSSFVKSE